LEQALQRLFMFHKNVLSSIWSVPQALPAPSSHFPQQNPQQPGRPILVASGGGAIPSNQRASSRTIDLVSVASHRFAAFFAEAAVLVLVLALLDRLIARGSIGTSWIVGAIALSLSLLAASMAIDFTALRWLKAH
jgi:hypothetical protein